MTRRPERMNCPAYPQSDDDFWMDDDDMLVNINAARMQGTCVDDLIERPPAMCVDLTKAIEADERMMNEKNNS